MAAKKKAAAKPTPAKKAPAKKEKAPAAKKPAAVTEAMSKTQLLAGISETTGLSKKQVQGVLDELTSVIGRHIGKKGVGQFTLPGLFKISVTNKPATKARKGINPFTKEEVTFKAKPARNIVKVRPLKKLKDLVN
jgi:nucleoid DNA-binding protein